MKMPMINAKTNTRTKTGSKKTLPRGKTSIRADVYALVTKFAKASRFNAREALKIGDIITSEWTIKGVTFWWRAKIIKAKNIAKDFGKPCRVYVLKYEKQKYYPKGMIMEHCFIDEKRLFDLTEKQLVSYYRD